MIPHPVPQQISAFQFRLFGNLTIRQFAFVGSGGLLAFLVFLSPLPGLLKAPLIITFAGGGALAGLVPIQGRSLDKWLFLFLKAIFSPTQRIWQKLPEVPYFLQPAILTIEGPALTPFALTESRLRLEEYLKSLPTAANSLDAAERLFLESLDFELKIPAGVAVKFTPPAKTKVTLKEEVAEITLTPRLGKEPTEKIVAEVALPKTDEALHILPGLEVEKRRPVLRAKKAISLASEINFAQEQVIIIPQGDQTKMIPGIGSLRVRRLHSQPDLTGEISLPPHKEKRFEISEELKRRLGLTEAEEQLPPTPTPTITISDQKIARVKPKAPISIPKPKILVTELKKEDGEQKVQKPQAAEEEAMVAPAAPTPVKPTVAKIPQITNTPNVLSGIVVDKNGSILEGAIILVKNEAKIPVRALKTNKLGQFVISTPLPNGNYTIEAEREGSNFDIIEIQAQGVVMPPIEICAK